MLVAFLWLTVGISFLSVLQQKQSNNKTTPKAETEGSKKTSARFENASEEKTETNPTSFSPEYLKANAQQFLPSDIHLTHDKCSDTDFFVNFFGDSVSQPPETLSC